MTFNVSKYVALMQSFLIWILFVFVMHTRYRRFWNY